MKIKLLKNYCGYPAGKIGFLESHPPHIKHGVSYLVFDGCQLVYVRWIDKDDVYMIIPENDAEENHA